MFAFCIAVSFVAVCINKLQSIHMCSDSLSLLTPVWAHTSIRPSLCSCVALNAACVQVCAVGERGTMREGESKEWESFESSMWKECADVLLQFFSPAIFLQYQRILFSVQIAAVWVSSFKVMYWIWVGMKTFCPFFAVNLYCINFRVMWE